MPFDNIMPKIKRLMVLSTQFCTHNQLEEFWNKRSWLIANDYLVYS